MTRPPRGSRAPSAHPPAARPFEATPLPGPGMEYAAVSDRTRLMWERWDTETRAVLRMLEIAQRAVVTELALHDGRPVDQGWQLNLDTLQWQRTAPGILPASSGPPERN